MQRHHNSFSSVDKLLLPETLSELLQQEIESVEVSPLPQNDGRSGSELSRVRTSANTSFVLKQFTANEDWFLHSTRDRLCRSVTLYEYGLLDQLEPLVQHAIIGCVREENQCAILMSDISEGLLSTHTAISPLNIETALDVLSHIHSEYWESEELSSPELGLCDAQDFIGCMLPTTPAKYPHLSGWIPNALETGWTILKDELDQNTFSSLEQLVNNPVPLYTALEKYPSTLVHGDYKVSNMSYATDGDLVVFDWQMAANSLMSIDLFWYLDKTEFYRSNYSVDRAVQFYLARLTKKLGDRIDPADIQAMMDLGHLSNALRMGVFAAQHLGSVTDEGEKKRVRTRLDNYSDAIRTGLRWL